MCKLKRVFIVVIFMVLFLLVNNFLYFALVPPNITRVILHEIEENSDFDNVFVGTSHGLYAIDPMVVDQYYNHKSLNLCMGGEYLQDTYYILKRIFDTKTPSSVILDMDFEYLTNVPARSATGKSIYKEIPLSFTKLECFKDEVMNMDYREALFPWLSYRENLKLSKMKEIIKNKLSKDYQEYKPSSVKMNAYNVYKDKGFVYRERYAHKEGLGHLNWDESKVDKQELKYLIKIISLCRKHDTKIIMISSPIPVEQILYTPDQFAKAYNYLSDLARKDGIEYYNFNLLKENLFTRTINEYNDYDGHMYGDTAEHFSVLLGKFLNEMDKGNLNTTNYFYNSLSEIPPENN